MWRVWTGNGLSLKASPKIDDTMDDCIQIRMDFDSVEDSWDFWRKYSKKQDVSQLMVVKKTTRIISTDQDAAMAKALGVMMENKYHGLCRWHFNQNALKHLSCYQSLESDILGDFYRCMYEYEDVDEFEVREVFSFRCLKARCLFIFWRTVSSYNGHSFKQDQEAHAIYMERTLSQKQYHDLMARHFVSGLCVFLSSGLVIAMVWEGDGVIIYGRKLIRVTDP
ncbi:nucleoside diphosphate kinase iii chloroplastic/mitochondrial [Phtheirospermum japonicum]|uniref:Protein FAR1-RELATED SEQUENCE n=1 Tax=Phtheirospermum japonicum TaxID=374723 RepID=A0A830DPF5_9LAMI|nr:nucleoside diphosphate kinase iii chloroplastic/mitochondrial [Phtheirospermum japonicum]